MPVSTGFMEESRILVQRPGFRYVPAEPVPWLGEGEPLVRPVSQPVGLSKHDRARAVALTDAGGGCAQGGRTGYRSILGTTGVPHGEWYFECCWEGKEGSTVRFGIAQLGANLLGPIGFDALGYSLCRDGSVYHLGKRQPYASEGFKVGDILGCLLRRPEPTSTDQHHQACSTLRGSPIDFHGTFLEQAIPPPSPCGHSSASHSRQTGSLEFFINGESLGPVFVGQVSLDCDYYPAFSLYQDPILNVNFGPEFIYPCVHASVRPWCQSRRVNLIASSISDLRTALAGWSRQQASMLGEGGRRINPKPQVPNPKS